MNKLFHYKDLERFSKEVFQKIGFSKEHAQIISNSLVLANLRGVDSHGVVRIQYYTEGVKKGLINPNPKIKTLKNENFFSIIDGDKTLGYIPATLATSLVISKAKEHGIGLVGVINLRHVGMLANYIKKVVNEKLFGLAIANASPNIGLHGFKKPVVGTNPLAIGFPVDGSKSIILDMAMSVVAKGKLLLASKKEIEIPKGWALNERGEDTTNPNEAIKGMLLPIGGYKGFGLALAIDIICGIILGGVYGLKMERTWFSQGGFLISALRIDLARSYDEYLREIKEYIKEVKATPVSEGVKVMFPNEIEEEITRRRIKEGIPVEDETFEEFVRLAKEYGISPPKPLNL
jgi:LDH2 family malate/lactate/ureidoglycolate dehydrogenase